MHDGRYFSNDDHVQIQLFKAILCFKLLVYACTPSPRLCGRQIEQSLFPSDSRPVRFEIVTAWSAVSGLPEQIAFFGAGGEEEIEDVHRHPSARAYVSSAEGLFLL